MRFYVEILRIKEEPAPRHAEVLEVYDDIEARSLEEARLRGLERFEREHQGEPWDVVYGKARGLA